MKIKYLDQTNEMEEIPEVNLEIEFYEGLEVTKKMIKNSWSIFIEDVLKLRCYAKKYGILECYEESMKFSMISSSNKRKIDTTWGIHNNHLEPHTYVKHPRTCYLKYPYLYRDLKEYGRYDFPIFMKSIYDRYDNIKIQQVAGFGKILINSTYFSDIKLDFFINKRRGQKLDSTKFNTIELFLNRLTEKTNKKILDTNFNIVLDKYSDINSDYYVFNIVEDKNDKNFYDDILEKEELWRYMYHTIINFELNKFDDYRFLLDDIVINSQKFL